MLPPKVCTTCVIVDLVMCEIEDVDSVCRFSLVVRLLILSLRSKNSFYLDFSCSFYFPGSRIFCENTVAMKEIFGVNFQEIDYTACLGSW